jgi:hypothetical protein
MARTAQLLTNPDAETGTTAGWTAASNTINSGSGGFVFAGSRTFNAAGPGAYDFYQDVAIPGGSIAAVDAGTYCVDYDGFAARTNGSTTVTITLKALNGVGAVLQTWSATVSTTGKPYTVLTVRMVTLPVGTRTVRAGWSGNAAIGGDGWFESAGLYFEDVELATTKFQGYAVAGDPPSYLVATKFNEYAISGAANPGTLIATKFIAYGVLTSDGRSHQRIKVRLVQRTGAIT